jgi:hypothetical protein
MPSEPEHDHANDPVIGDGVVTVPPLQRQETVDIPPSVGALLISESAGNIQNTNLSGRNIANIAMGALQAGVARVHNELSTEESRAISGVMATPVAPPSTGGTP